MALYEYQCQQCGRRSEVLQKMADAPLTTCEVCGGPLKRLVSSPAVQFKGSGWYVTDYARKGGGSAGKEGKEGKEGGKEGGATEGGDKPAAAASESKAGGDSKPAASSAASSSSASSSSSSGSSSGGGE